MKKPRGDVLRLLRVIQTLQCLVGTALNGYYKAQEVCWGATADYDIPEPRGTLSFFVRCSKSGEKKKNSV